MITSQDATAPKRELNGILAAHKGEIEDAAYDAVRRAVKASDADDMKRAGGAPLWPRQVEGTVQGVARILARDNLQMVESAQQAFLTASVEAVTQVNTGYFTADRALHSAVRKLERSGTSVIQYQNAKTGARTVANKVDVAFAGTSARRSPKTARA